MKKFLLLFSISLFVILSSCNKKTEDLTEEEIYTILNQIIADDSLKIYTVCSKFIEHEIDSVYAEEFQSEDNEFIARQKHLLTTMTIKPNKLMWFVPSLEKPEFITLDTNCTAGTEISFPIISADRQKVLIEIYYNKGNFTASSGGTYLYIKDNGKWKLKTGKCWISMNRASATTGNSALATSGHECM